eukprot:m.23783 g.23783  ORF g.23783 m.23783 type:complete len:313 (+) comp5585_c0_seq1:129-1067(+)
MGFTIIAVVVVAIVLVLDQCDVGIFALECNGGKEWSFTSFENGTSFLHPELARKYPFPSSLMKEKCGLVVVCAGAPRSGSTLQFGIVHEVTKTLVMLGGRLGGLHSFHNAGYWMQHVHNNNEAMGIQFEKTIRRKINEWDRNSIIIVKSHDFDEALLTLCNNYVAFTTYRDPLDVMASYVRRNWISNTAVNTMCSSVAHILNRHATWARYASINTKYETSTQNMFAYVAEIFYVLAGDIVPNATKVELSKALEKIWNNDEFQKEFILRDGEHVNVDMLATNVNQDGYPFPDEITYALKQYTNSWRKTMGYEA